MLTEGGHRHRFAVEVSGRVSGKPGYDPVAVAENVTRPWRKCWRNPGARGTEPSRRGRLRPLTSDEKSEEQRLITVMTGPAVQV